jgi:hypothetical protein
MRLAIPAALALPLFVLGCQATSVDVASTPTAPASIGPATPPPGGVRACGQETVQMSRGRDPAARECLARAAKDGVPAQLTTTVFTIEGDPIRYEVTVKGAGVIEVVRDSRDRFGAQGTTRATCSSARRDDAMGVVRLVLDGCTGEASQIALP